MKKKILLPVAVMLLGCLGLRAQDYCNTPRYYTTGIFNLLQLELDTVVYGQNTDWQGQPQNVSMIISYPSAVADTATKRPLVILIHGGGFTTGNYADFGTLALGLASRGFVAATVQYRLGWQTGCVPNNYSLPEAVYRANQDVRAAVRYCIANAAYRVDPDYVFLFGSSAGAVTALHMQYADENTFEALQPGMVTSLGPLDASTNTHTGTYRIRGIISAAGGIHDTMQISGANMVPALMFHGTDDTVIPFTEGYPYGCTFFPEFYGASAIAQRMKNLSGCYEFCYQPGAGHDAYSSEGTFVQTRATEFIKRVLCDNCRQITYEGTTLKEDIPLALETPGLPQLSVYPNPVSEGLHILADAEDDYHVQVYDMKGAAVYDGTFRKQLKISFEAFSPGLYTVRVMAGGKTQSYKIIRE